MSTGLSRGAPPSSVPAEQIDDQVRPESCDLCGQPLGGGVLPLAVSGQTLRFCCPGCRNVFEILSVSSAGGAVDFRDTALYGACVAAGFIPGAAGKAGQAAAVPAAWSGREIDDPGLTMTLKVEGMWCTACAWLIREILIRLPGVLTAEVFFFSDLARFSYLPHRIVPQEIVERLGRLGYRARPCEEETVRGQAGSWLGLGVAAILTMNVMMISLMLYGGFFQTLEEAGIRSLALPLCLLATPVVFYSGWPILVRGWQGARLGRPSMDTLIAVGTLAAYGYSLAQLQRSSLHLYFDTAAMLITLVLLGREVEGRVRRRLDLRTLELGELAGAKVRRLTEGREQWVAAAAVGRGDLVVVKGGERVPVDSRVVSGRAAVDESVLTGEPRPVEKAIDDEVLAGSLLEAGELRLEATRVGPASSLGQMIELVQKALAAKTPVEQLADRLSRWFVPLIVTLAGGTFLTLRLSGQPAETALLRALTVLVIACPCAFGIATPLAKVAVLAAARRRGILLRAPAAFEQAHRLDTLVFDKTGTVSQGSFSLIDLYAPEQAEAEVLRRVAAAESGAEHFLAREIRRQVAERGLEPVVSDNWQTHVGLGVTARIDGDQTAVGSRRFMGELGLPLPGRIDERATLAEGQGSSVVFAAWQGEVRALLVFGDTIKAGAGQVIDTLLARGLQVWLVSGDSPATTAAVAGQLGIANFHGQARPADKAALIRRLQAEGRRVGMIGDGINDTAALALADVGFALGSHPARLIDEAADVTLFGSSLDRLLASLTLSERMSRGIRQNLTLAFLYNGLGICLAMLGLLNPLLAVLAMFASSLTVLGNTLRVVRLPDRELS